MVFHGLDEAGAQEYIERLTENGWSGDGGQLYKSFEWNGKSYTADIEIYETVETRTTFTCNFYLSAAEPTPQAVTTTGTSASVEGVWTLGMLSGGAFNAATGKYEGGASGMGQVYTFRPDGTYTALVVFGDTIWFAGKYSVQDDVLTLTDRTAEESKDGGKTWGAVESLPDASAHFSLGATIRGHICFLARRARRRRLWKRKTR